MGAGSTTVTLSSVGVNDALAILAENENALDASILDENTETIRDVLKQAAPGSSDFDYCTQMLKEQLDKKANLTQAHAAELL